MVNEENQLCIVYSIFEIYCEYFNFTLLDMIKHKKTMDNDELWLCFNWLLSLAIKLKEKKINIEGGFSLNKIFITLKGHPIRDVHDLQTKK